MKKKYRMSKSLRAGRRKPGIGRYVVGASLIVLGAQAARAGDAITPQQWFEGGTNTYSNTGVFGGIEDLHYEDQVAKKTTFTLDGHSIFDDHDYSVSLGLVRDDLGFVRATLRISAPGIPAPEDTSPARSFHMRCRATRWRWTAA
jgi:hypothetical protein